MPSLANITVKKNDGTTDVVYSAQSPATPNTPAVFQAPALASNQNTRPEFRVGSTRNNKGGYRVTSTMLYPYAVTDSTTTVTTVAGGVRVRRTVEADAGIPQTVIDEAVSQSANLHAATLPKDCEKQGFGPT